MTSELTKEYLAKYADRVGASAFFNDPIAEMTREELLCLVGWMQDEMQRMEDRHTKEREIQRDFRAALRR